MNKLRLLVENSQQVGMCALIISLCGLMLLLSSAFDLL